MAISYKDFVPEITKEGYFSKQHEALAATVARSNEWVMESGVRVINVETVVLPNIAGVDEASKIEIRTSGEIGSYWYQVIRIWYETPDPPGGK